MTYNVLMGTLNPTHSLIHPLLMLPPVCVLCVEHECKCMCQ